MYMVRITAQNCEPSGIPNTRSHIVKNFMVLSLAWRWLFKSKHVALTYAYFIWLCWLEYISIKWLYLFDWSAQQILTSYMQQNPLFLSVPYCKIQSPQERMCCSLVAVKNNKLSCANFWGNTEIRHIYRFPIKYFHALNYDFVMVWN